MKTRVYIENRKKWTGSLQKEKTGTYTIRAMINGKRFSKGTGTKNKQEAERIMEQYLRAFVKGDEVRTLENLQAFAASAEARAEREEDAKPQLKLIDAWEAYKASPQRSDQAEITLNAKQKVWEHWVKWLSRLHPEIEEVRHVNVEMVEEYLAFLRVDHAASTYNNRLCCLREMTRVLMRKSRQKENPWENMKQRRTIPAAAGRSARSSSR